MATVATVGRTNSRAAADWAAKRRLQMERAAALKAERQAVMRGQRDGDEENLDLGPGAADYAPSADVSAARRTYSQPASDQLSARGAAANLAVRPNTEAGDGALPEWARDFSASREQRAHKHAVARGYDGAAYDGYGVYDEPPPHAGDMEAAYPYASEPSYAAAAAVANRWPENMPLGQSDGGIGYNRGRAMPRGTAMPDHSSEVSQRRARPSPPPLLGRRPGVRRAVPRPTRPSPIRHPTTAAPLPPSTYPSPAPLRATPNPAAARPLHRCARAASRASAGGCWEPRRSPARPARACRADVGSRLLRSRAGPRASPRLRVQVLRA